MNKDHCSIDTSDTISLKTKTQNKPNRLGQGREWKLKEEYMPQVIMHINCTQKARYNEYLESEFSQTDFAKSDKKFAIVETAKYPEYVFLQCSNPHALCLILWKNKVLNKYMNQTYLCKQVTTDMHYIANHESLFGENKIIKLFGDKRCIAALAPLIPKQIELTPSEKKCTHALYIIKAYHKYYFGVFEKNYCYGYLATSVKLEYSSFTDSSISRAYYKLREVFLREHLFFKSLKSNFTALDIGSSPGGWTKYLLDIGAKTVVSVDPGQLRLDDVSMQSVIYYEKTIEKCIDDGDLIAFRNIGHRFDIIVCDANMDPINAVDLINNLCHHLNDNGFIIFTLKMPDRKKFRMASRTQYCTDILSKSFENITLCHLLANRSKERTLIATKKETVLRKQDVRYTFHKIHSF